MDEINSLESDPFFLNIFLEDFSLPLDKHGIKISQEFLFSGEEGITFAEIEKINILRNRLYLSRLSLNSSETNPEVLLKNAYESLKREIDSELSAQEKEDKKAKCRILEKNKNSVDKFSHKEVYEIYDEFKSQDIARAKKNFISTCKELYVLRNKGVVSKENIKINFESLFDQLNSANLEEHFAMLPKTTWSIFINHGGGEEKKDLDGSGVIDYKIKGADPDSTRETEDGRVFRKLCFDCYFHRRKNLKDQPKNLTELLKKIDPSCDPDEEKIKKVLEEYKKYKELDGGKEKLQKEQSKIVLKQAINDALANNILLPLNDETFTNAITVLKDKISLALNASQPNQSILQTENLTSECDENIYRKIVFQPTPEANNKIIKFTTVAEFNKFLVENGGTNLSEKEVQEAFEAYETYYKEALSLHTSELLKRLKENAITKVLDDEFDKIEGFLDKMPEAELNASLVTQPSTKLPAQGASMDESEPPAQRITVVDNKRDKVVDIKRDKVAEFKKFLEDNQLNCADDNIQKVFELHELYEAYQHHLEKSESEIQGEISITPENLRAFKNKIGELIFKKELSGSLGWGEVPKSSIKEPRVKLDQNKLKEILTFLNENRESEKIDNSWEILNPPLDELNKYHTDSIASDQKRAERKAKQEKPNEIIKFFFEDLPRNIIRVFDCTRTDSRTGKGPPQ